MLKNKKIIKKGKKSVNQMTTLFLSNSWPINSLSFDFFIGPIHIPGIPILSFDQIPTPIVFPTRVFSQPKKKNTIFSGQSYPVRTVQLCKNISKLCVMSYQQQDLLNICH